MARHNGGNADMGKSYVGLLVCPRCGNATGVAMDRRLKNTFEVGKEYADSEVCDACQKQLNEWMEICKQGGVIFQCQECGMEGVMKLSDETRPLIEYLRSRFFGPDYAEHWHEAAGFGLDKCATHIAWGIGPGGKLLEDKDGATGTDGTTGE